MMKKVRQAPKVTKKTTTSAQELGKNTSALNWRARGALKTDKCPAVERNHKISKTFGQALRIWVNEGKWKGDMWTIALKWEKQNRQAARSWKKNYY